MEATDGAKEEAEDRNAQEQIATPLASEELECAAAILEPPKEALRLPDYRCNDGSSSPITTMPNVCVSTVHAMYEPAADGTPAEKRFPGSYSLSCESTPACQSAKSTANRVVVGCHLDLDNRTVTFKSGPGSESELPPVSVDKTAQGVCPLIAVWDASCKVQP